MLHIDFIEKLMVIRPRGVVDADVAGGIVEFVEFKEEQLENGFDRFCDLTLVDGIRLSLADVCVLASRRRAFNPNHILVKSAFLAPNPLAFGIARMYEQMLDSPRIAVRVWRDLERAADWLEVDPDKVRP